MNFKSKIFALITALVFGASVASAEESGVFFGLGVGYGDLKLESKVSLNGVSAKTEAKGGGRSIWCSAGL